MSSKLKVNQIHKNLIAYQYRLIGVLSLHGVHSKLIVACNHQHIRHVSYDALKRNPICKKCQPNSLTYQIEQAHFKIINYQNRRYQALCPHGNPCVIRTKFDIKCHCYENYNSFGEKIIYNILQQNHLAFDYQYRFEDPTTKSNHYLDFVVYRHNQNPLIIEYDGLQHYQQIDYFKSYTLLERQKRDQIKNNYAKEKAFDILRIPYTNDTTLKIYHILNQYLNIKKPTKLYDIYNMQKITKYYLQHNLAQTSQKFKIRPQLICEYFKKIFGYNKTAYLHKKNKVINYYLTHTMLETTKQFNISSNTLYRLTKSYLHMTKSEYLQKERINNNVPKKTT